MTNALAAAAIGVVQLGLAISLAALIFSGPLSDGAGRAAAGFLLGTAVVSGLVGAMSKMSIVIAGAQDTAAIMIAAGAAAIVASPDLASTEAIPTVFMMIAISGVLTGIVFWAVGAYGLTTFVRYLPFPVISGFTAGTGWLLFRGGIEVMTGHAVELADVADLFGWSQAKFILPGLGLALIMLLVVSFERLPNTLLSVAILGGSVVFHLIAQAVSDLDSIERDGWLIGPFADDAGWAPIRPSDFEGANWSVLLDNSLIILAVVAVSVIGLLLNLSGLESGPDTRIDMNTEIRSAGIANVFAGLGSGLIGYHLLGDITLARQIGARGRIVPIAISGIAGVVFFLGLDLIALVPRAVAGGVLAGLGVTLLARWVTASLPRMNRGDQLMSAVILLIIALFGVLAGVGAGVVIAAAVFIVKYSRTDPVRHVIEAAGRSMVDRDERDKAILLDNQQSILAFELQGYLFFGSTTQVRRQIEDHVVDGQTQFVIIDFGRVTGIDSTAASGLQAIASQLDDLGVVTLFSAVSTDVMDELRRDDVDVRQHHVDLDHAIASCEDAVITAAERDHSPTVSSGLEPFDKQLMAALELPRLPVKAGETLINSGDTDSDVYFVESGRLTAWLPTGDGKLIRMRQVLPGAALGEIAFCTGAIRTATVIADTDAVIRVLKRERFDELAETDPDVALAVQHELLRRLSTRLTSTSAMVRDLLK